MPNTKKYVSLDKLSLYDEKIKKVISDADAATLAAANEFATNLGANYDAAGAAATAEANAKAYAKEYADGKDAAIQAAQKAADDAATAASTADGKAVAAQDDVDALEEYVGTFTASEGVDTVVKYIDAKTANIASDETVSALADRVTQAETDIDNIEKDYLKGADKTELEGKITAVETAVATEKSRAEGIEGGLETRLAAVEADYLKGADKTALEGQIALKADKTALDAEIERATGIEGGLRTDVDAIKADYLKAADKEELQGNIDEVAEALETLTNGISAEEIDGVNDLIAYVNEHGAEVIAMQEDIAANAKAIEDHEALAAQTYETKEDATAKYDEVKAEIAAIPHADWNQNDETAADYVKNRTHYDNSSIEYLLENVAMSNMTSQAMGAGHIEYPDGVVPTWEVGKTYYLDFNGATYTSLPAEEDRIVFMDIVHPSDSQYSQLNVYFKKNYIETLGFYDKNYDWENSNLTLSVYSGTTDIKQLDEKFIPDTIARVASVEAVEGRVTTAEGKITTLEGKVSANEEAIAALQGEDTTIKGRLDTVEAQLGDGEGSVTDLIADAKAETLEEAAADAAAKDTQVLTDAKGYADGLDTAMNTRVEALEAIDHEHANKAELDLIATGDKTKWDAAAAKAHEHTNLDVLEGITAAKVTAWDGAEQAAKTYADGLNTAMNTRVASLESWHENFVECSQEDINGLFA